MSSTILLNFDSRATPVYDEGRPKDWGMIAATRKRVRDATNKQYNSRMEAIGSYVDFKDLQANQFPVDSTPARPQMAIINATDLEVFSDAELESIASGSEYEPSETSDSPMSYDKYKEKKSKGKERTKSKLQDVLTPMRSPTPKEKAEARKRKEASKLVPSESLLTLTLTLTSKHHRNLQGARRHEQHAIIKFS